MLSDTELRELCQRRQLGQEAVAVIHHVRQSPPSRVVRSGTGNLVTNYASHKMGCVIKAEAKRTELAAIYEWDHDKVTYEFYDQPPPIKKIRKSQAGKVYGTNYTPDFFRIAEDFIGWVECKSENDLEKLAALPSPDYVRDEHGAWRCPSAEEYAAQQGLEFCVRSTAETDPIVIQNIADLSDYYRKECPRPTEEELKQAETLMGRDGWCWLRDLLSNDCGLSADRIFKLIADEKLHVDLSIVCVMREPHRVRVYRSQILMDSSHLWLPSLTCEATNPISVVPTTNGTTLLWDGKACVILNYGHSAVFLQMADAAEIRELPIDQFEKMVKRGVLVAVEPQKDPRKSQAAKLLSQSTSDDIRAAMHRYYSLHPELCPADQSHQASQRALRKWRRLAQEGEVKYGNEFVGLIPSTHKRGNRTRRVDEVALQIMHDIINTEVKHPSAPGNTNAWSLVVAKCKTAGVLAPSKKTFATEIRRLCNPEELKKAREGEKAGYDLETPFLSIHRETPRHGTRPFGIAHIDHTQLDLQMVNEETGMEMGKPWLTVMIDAFTRMILGWIITFDAPSYRSCMLVVRDCARRHGRIPSMLIVDHGPEFGSIYLDQLIAFLRIHKMQRPASQPRFGNVVERFFGLNNTEFIHSLHGNNKALQAPRRMSPTHDPRNLAVWNLRAFNEAFEAFLKEVYHASEIPSLGISPMKALEIGLMQSGARAHCLINYDRDFIIATMPTTKKGTSTIQKNCSFKANYIEYYAPALAKHIGQKLPVRYNPFDISRAYIQTDKGWIEAYSLYQDQLAGRTEKEIEIISIEKVINHGRAGIREKDRALLLGQRLENVRSLEQQLALDRQRARDRALQSSTEDSLINASPAKVESINKATKVKKTEYNKSKFESIKKVDFKDF